MSKAQELKPDLRPCPMCGGTEILVKKRKTTMVECKACGLVVFDCQDGIERDAIAHWNTRAPASSEQQAAQLDERIAKLTTAYSELSKILHDQIVAQQSAWIEWQHGQGAEAAMVWIGNGLLGPGHIPDEDATYGKEAQAWYDANNSDPFPACQCGRPSNMMWMGQGFCCQAHSDAARASNGGKA